MISVHLQIHRLAWSPHVLEFVAIGTAVRHAQGQAGIKGVQIVRENAWLIALAPSVIGIVSGLLRLRKKETPKRGLFDFWKKKAGTSEEEADEIESKASRRARPLLRRLLGHGVTAFKLYRRVRPFIPL